jgi:hypothetical protein
LGWAWDGSGQHLELAFRRETPKDFAMLGDARRGQIFCIEKKGVAPAALGLKPA